MSISRQGNWLGQQRVDVPHLRALESSIAADFDAIVGQVMAGGQALVLRGCKLNMTGAIGAAASALTMIVAGGAIMHPLAAESGSLYLFEDDAAPELLATTNSKVIGAFVANAVNFVGVDLRRVVDTTTNDTVMFLDPLTKTEVPKTVALGRILEHRIVISTVDFATATNVCPIAKVTTNSSGQVVSVEDCRNMMFRLGKGGTYPNASFAYTWSRGREEVPSGTTIFDYGDKELNSEKEWRDAIMSRIWEIGGGERWFSPTTEREVKLTYGQPVLVNGDNFLWTLGTNTLQWTSLKLAFANSTAVTNSITDGSLTLAAGECLYVDVNRSVDATVLTMQKAQLRYLGAPAVPGSRFVIAWRVGNEVFIKDKQYEAGRTYATVATPSASGLVKLTNVAGNPADPLVVPIDASSTLAYAATATSGLTAISGTTNGGVGVRGVAGGTFGGTAIVGEVGASAIDGIGGSFTGKGNGVGISVTAGASNRAANFAGGSLGGIRVNFSNSAFGFTASQPSVSVNGNGAEYLALRNTSTAATGSILFSMLHSDAADSNLDGWMIGTNKIADDDIDLHFIRVVDTVAEKLFRIDSSTNALVTETGVNFDIGGTTAPFRNVKAKSMVAVGSATLATVTTAGAAVALSSDVSRYNIQADAAARTVTTITGGEDGQTVYLFVIGSFALQFNHGTGTDNIALNGNTNFSGAVGSCLQLIRHNGTWFEMGRKT